jgi:hypothetical protein
MADAAANRSVNHTTLTLVDGTLAGEQSNTLTCAFCTPGDPTNEYDRIRDTVLTPKGLTEQQVQVVWIQTVLSSPTVELPQSTADAFQEEIDYGSILRAMRQRWPNVSQVFFSTPTYTGYATSHLFPEPYSYEDNFSVKWLVAAQINQRRSGTIDPLAGDLITSAPFVDWGPYLWGSDSANPPGSQAITWVAGDFIADGIHPAPAGITKCANALMSFFLNSDLTPWFRAQ